MSEGLPRYEYTQDPDIQRAGAEAREDAISDFVAMGHRRELAELLVDSYIAALQKAVEDHFMHGTSEGAKGGLQELLR